MSGVWTPEEVARVMAAEKEKRFYAKNESMRPRVDAIRVVQEAVRMADLWYVNRYAQMKRDLEIGLIGPKESHGHKVNFDVWLAAEVRHVLLRELHDESPIREDEEK